MTTSSPKSYNHLALRGAGVDDMEFISDWNSNVINERRGRPKMDESLAYTPKIMEFMLDRQDEDNHEVYINEGMSDADAAAKVKEGRAKSDREYRELLAKNGMLK